MHGTALRRPALALALPLLLLPLGCDGPAAPPPSPEGPSPDAASLFDPTTAGTLTGRIAWSGPRPVVPPFRSRARPLLGRTGGAPQDWPNPHAPRIGPAGEVAGAVVFLRGVDPRRARPWDHLPVRVELRDHQLHVLQGGRDAGHGFVRRGDVLEMASAQDVFHTLQARGASFFARAFPEPGPTCTQALLAPGVVELMSGSGAYWMRAHLFVDDHPYYARSGADGRFALERVPPGDYELVCWLPDWRTAERELDADSALVWRLKFHPPWETVQRVRLGARERKAIDVAVAAP